MSGAADAAARFAGRTALVTGSASGIGRAIASALVAEGAVVYGGDLAEQSALAAELGPAFRPLHLDVTEEESVAAAVGEAEGIDLAFNVAGASRPGPIADLDRAAWDFTLDLVLTGVFLSVKHEARAMAARGGAIVTIGSINGRIPMHGGSAYVSAKAGVEAFSRTAAVELAPAGIRVNCVVPGLVATPLTASFRAVPELGAAMIDRTLLKRVAEPREVAEPALFLASDAASYITGASLVVDGGWEVSNYPDLTRLLPQ